MKVDQNYSWVDSNHSKSKIDKSDLHKDDFFFCILKLFGKILDLKKIEFQGMKNGLKPLLKKIAQKMIGKIFSRHKTALNFSL